MDNEMNGLNENSVFEISKKNLSEIYIVND